MAPKPKKATTNEKTRKLINRAYDLRTIEKIGATSADKAKRNRQSLDAGKTATRAIAISNRADKKKAAAKKASYSPAPMSAAAKAKAKKAGAAAQTKTGKMSPAQAKQFKQIKELPRGAKAGSSAVSKVVKRAKIVAREARDIPTAVGRIKDVVTDMPRTGAKGGKARQLRNAAKNIGTQIKETGKAAVTGKKGRPDQKYQTATGDTPATFWTQPKRK